MWNEVIIEVIELVFMILGTLATGLLGLLFMKLRSKASSQEIKDALNTVESEAISVVAMLNQTIVEDLKDAGKDGKWTEEEAKKVLNTAVQNLSAVLPEKTKNILKKHGVDLAQLFLAKIENAVAWNKY